MLFGWRRSASTRSLGHGGRVMVFASLGSDAEPGEGTLPRERRCLVCSDQADECQNVLGGTAIRREACPSEMAKKSDEKSVHPNCRGKARRGGFQPLFGYNSDAFRMVFGTL